MLDSIGVFFGERFVLERCPNSAKLGKMGESMV